MEEEEEAVKEGDRKRGREDLRTEIARKEGDRDRKKRERKG